MTETWIGGFHAVMAAIDNAAQRPQEILLVDTRHDQRARDVQSRAKAAGIPVRSAQRYELDLRAPGLRHQGFLASIEVAALEGEALLDLPAAPDALLLMLDGVTDPHNLGACLRTAEATGVNAVILPRDRAAGLTPVARKAAAGAAERVPVVAVTNLSRSLQTLRGHGYWTVGLAGDGGESLYDLDLRGPLVFVMGAEGGGLRRLTREHCDHLVRIPMRGTIESLNVSVAAAVCLYEALRQRSKPAR
ncbi:MAG: 23S rRNA (guanosine(2251)-2'-O)-methyltransferase RlmB [Nevskiaceae bacterium]|nr:MAG: 23S rRNA (guanosine(2251)-2'-O)-methyltransferase RlmB [Burkholderiaceae bacterium]TBR72357.1 MAG: 23S rRNA (guanosine(2251)-2'-O)-methyltransferase RlmB [Nevskiaceae bacterium]